MKLSVRLFHFLGGVRFAITLIVCAALFVIAGTFLESATGSHRFAAFYVYQNPIFKLLIWLFFINILFSTLRRWPFKTRHIPFLITHLGLLMILGGTLIKSYAGIQGTMGIWEGSSSQQIFLPDTYVIWVEKRTPSGTIGYQFPLVPEIGGGFRTNLQDQRSIWQKWTGAQIQTRLPDLPLTLVAYLPHVAEEMETWIKSDRAVVNGLPPLPLHHWKKGQADLPKAEQRLGFLDVLAVHTSDLSELAQEIYLQNLQLLLNDRESGRQLLAISLQEVLDHPVIFEGGSIQKGELQLGYHPVHGFKNPLLTLDLALDGEIAETVRISLDGPEALLNRNEETAHLGQLPVAIDLKRTPTLLLAQDAQKTDHVLTFSKEGVVAHQSFPKENIETLIVYDQGYGGYAIQADLRIPSYSQGRDTRESATLYYLAEQLREAMRNNPALAPPLQLLAQACQKTGDDFVDTCLHFLTEWNHTRHWLYPADRALPKTLTRVLEQIDWKTLPRSIQKGCLWSCQLFSELEPQLRAGKKIGSLLPKGNEGQPEAALMLALTQQVFTEAPALSDTILDLPETPLQKARWLSAYLRAYNIHLSTLMPSASEQEITDRLKSYLRTQNETTFHDTLTIETPLTRKSYSKSLEKKWEDNKPQVILEMGTNGKTIALAYDRFATGLKWASPDGEYLLRFQPQHLTIPYRVRLRDARQISYPHSSQPFSYESDLIFTDLRDQSVTDKTISMNRVHQTWDGYRFYLGNIAPKEEIAPQRIQLIVNHDPAKYLLTYPGGIILTCGIVLLFWKYPTRKED